jgi:hypothetical protein
VQGLPRRVKQASIAPQLRDNPYRRTSAGPAPGSAVPATGPASGPGSAAPVSGPASGPTPAEIRQTMSALQRGWQEGRSQRIPGDSPFESPGPEPSADGDELRGESDGA